MKTQLLSHIRQGILRWETVIPGEAIPETDPVEYEEDTTEIDYGGNIPQAIKQAMLLLLGTWYQQREGASDAKGFQTLPFGVKEILSPSGVPGMSRIGELNDRIIKREKRTTDGMGGWTVNDQTVATVWAGG